jgi:peptidoglycan/xylan/chitin deacetylase (PgdA/CDA1 family)
MYYTHLAPFRAVFSQGNPVLTYHKLGARPRDARLKGMYLSLARFQRQLEELREAGFETGALPDCVGPPMARCIVITFDDGYENVWRHGLGPLAATKFKAIQFLVADALGKQNTWDMAQGEAPERLMDGAQIREWLEAGHDIGSHSLSHPFLTRLPLSQAREEISASRKKLEDLFSRRIEHFCYPYGDWNEAVREMVAEAGYKTACTTQAGINTAQVSPFELRRFTARYPTRSLRAIWERLTRWSVRQ